MSDGQKVAVKVIKTEDEVVRRCSIDEYELINSLRHPNIVKVLELFESRACILICMELCLGGSIDKFISSHHVFSESAATPLFHHLLWGINYLHLKRIVHRDIKPSNLLLQKDTDPGQWVLKITDFNSSKRIGSGPGTSAMLSDRGTHLYSAPELRFGNVWNERVDIWASGMSFYFMRHGAAPFNILNAGIAMTLRSGRLPDVPFEGFSKLARALLLQCLTVEMRDRPTAMELVIHPIFHERNRVRRDAGKLRARSCELVIERPPPTPEKEGEALSPSRSYAKSPSIDDEDMFGCDDLTYFSRQVSKNDLPKDDNSPKWLRNHSDALQRLANIRCERVLAEQQHQEFAPSPRKFTSSPLPVLQASGNNSRTASAQKEQGPEHDPSETQLSSVTGLTAVADRNAFGESQASSTATGRRASG